MNWTIHIDITIREVTHISTFFTKVSINWTIQIDSKHCDWAHISTFLTEVNMNQTIQIDIQLCDLTPHISISISLTVLWEGAVFYSLEYDNISRLAYS